MIVLDSSVALKWIFADEDGAEHAVRIRDEHISAKNVIAVPSFFIYEIANVLASRLGCRFLTADRKFWEIMKGIGVTDLLVG